MSFPKVYLGFSGRINRLKFFLYAVLLALIVSIINYILGYMLNNSNLGNLIVDIIIAILNGYFFLALMMKRFHDMNQKGIYVIPIYIISLIIGVLFTTYPNVKIILYIYMALALFMLLVALTLLFTKGTSGSNQYGKDPLEKK